MKHFRKYRKYILASLIVFQSLIISIPACAYELFSDWDSVKDYIYENMESREKEIKFIYNGDKTNYGLKLKEELKDTYSRDDYLERSWIEIKPEAYDTKNGIETTLNIKYLCTKEEEEYIDSTLQEITSSLITENMSDLEKVKTINDYIINRYEYDYTFQSVSVYSALTTSKAVCQGYSMTAYKMFNFAGIENKIVVGTLKGIDHSWNLVKIDGKWYQIDITNNDSRTPNKYFLVNDQFLIYNNYRWDSKEYPTALNIVNY